MKQSLFASWFETNRTPIFDDEPIEPARRDWFDAVALSGSSSPNSASRPVIASIFA